MTGTIIRALLFSLALVLGFACSTGSGDRAGDSAPDEDTIAAKTICICGSPEADLKGCYCDDCLYNGGNPFNPECMCLPLRPHDELEKSFVGYDPAGGAVRPRVRGALVGMDELRLKKGGKVRGEVLEDDGEKIRFRHADGREVTYAYGELDHRMVYRLLKARSVKGDPEDEMKLATYARDCGLYAHSRRHYRYALDADPELKDEIEIGLISLRNRASVEEYRRARGAFDAGKASEARKHIATILEEFPGEPIAGEAGLLLRELNLQGMGAEQAIAAENLDPLVVTQLGGVGESYEKVVKKNEEGLLATGSPAKAQGSFKGAISEGERARKNLRRLEQKNQGDPGFAEGARSYEGLLLDVIGQAYRNLASLLLNQENYNGALGYANQALALNAQDAEASQLRARIESAKKSYDEGYQKGRAAAQRAQPRRRRSVLGLYGYYPGGGRIGYGGWGLGASLF